MIYMDILVRALLGETYYETNMQLNCGIYKTKINWFLIILVVNFCTIYSARLHLRIKNYQAFLSRLFEA